MERQTLSDCPHWKMLSWKRSTILSTESKVRLTAIDVSHCSIQEMDFHRQTTPKDSESKKTIRQIAFYSRDLLVFLDLKALGVLRDPL